VDLTLLPLFLHHDRDGHAYTSDNFVVSKNPDTGLADWGIHRSMFRTRNEKSFDMTCTSHRARLNAIAAQQRGQNLQLAVVIGGPTLRSTRSAGELAITVAALWVKLSESNPGGVRRDVRQGQGDELTPPAGAGEPIINTATRAATAAGRSRADWAMVVSRVRTSARSSVDRRTRGVARIRRTPREHAADHLRRVGVSSPAAVWN
jgi:3-octaprenyl-4-hydroxybenzoate carboxy-lyase